MTRLTIDTINAISNNSLDSQPDHQLELLSPDGWVLVVRLVDWSHQGEAHHHYGVERFNLRGHHTGGERLYTINELQGFLTGTLKSTADIMQIDGLIDAENINPKGVPAWRGNYHVEASQSRPDTGTPCSTERDALIKAAEGYADANSIGTMRPGFEALVTETIESYLAEVPPWPTERLTSATLIDWVINGADIGICCQAERTLLGDLADRALLSR